MRKSSLSYLRLMGLLAWASLIAACGSNNNEPELPDDDEPANRTVLVYIMAENSLSDYAEEGLYNIDSDIEEMIQGASDIPDNDHLIVFLDAANSSEMPRIYEIEKASGSTAAQAKLVKEYTEEVCSTDPAVLQEVLAYVKQNFPANGYGLVMWSHGSGWIPAEQVKDSRSIGIDNEKNTTSDSGPEMEISALAEVLADFGKLDFLYFDACYMQCIEVAYELRNVTDYVMGSPVETPATGAYYTDIIEPMFATTADIEGIVENNYNYYAAIYANYLSTGNDPNNNLGCLTSAIRCDELEALAQITEPIITREASGATVLSQSGVQAYRGSRTASSYPDFYDLRGTIYALAESDAEYDEWLEQFNKTVVYRFATAQWYAGSTGWNTVNTSLYGGVSLYVPRSISAYASWNSAFQDTAWYSAVWSETGW